VTPAQHIAFLQTLTAVLAVSNVLAVMVALAAWRWRAPGRDAAKMTAVERRVMRIVTGA